MIPTLQQVVSTLTAIFLTFQATFTGLPVSSQLAQIARTATLTLSPSATSVSVNNTFTANIIINTDGQGVYGVDINRLRFNPSILQVVDTDAGTAGVQITAGSLMPMVVMNAIDNSGGSIQFSALANPGSTYSGLGTLATVTFRAVSAGTSNVTFDFTLGSGIDTNVAGLGGDLLASVGNASYAGTVTTLSSLSVQRRIVIIPEGTPTNQRNMSGTVEFLNPSNGLKVFQASFTADSSGQYVMDVPAGLLSTVNFRPVISGYLSRTLSNIDLRNTSVLDANFLTLPAGDFNSDQLINTLDFSYMNGKWGTNDPLSDINRDGIVNSLDFAYVSNNWLLAGN